MILKKGKDSITINKFIGELLNVYIVIKDNPPHFIDDKYHITLNWLTSSKHFINKEREGIPKSFVISVDGLSKTVLEFDSKADRDYQIAVRYYPPVEII